MEFNVSTFIWSILNFLALFLVLRRFVWKPLLGMMEARQREVSDNLAHAENTREEAIRMKAEYEQRLAEAQRRAEEIVVRASKKAEELQNELTEKAQVEAGKILERAQEVIQRQKEEALAELRGQVAEMAVDVAGKVLGRSLDDQDHERLAREFVARVGEVQ